MISKPLIVFVSTLIFMQSLLQQFLFTLNMKLKHDLNRNAAKHFTGYGSLGQLSTNLDLRGICIFICSAIIINSSFFHYM